MFIILRQAQAVTRTSSDPIVITLDDHRCQPHNLTSVTTARTSHNFRNTFTHVTHFQKHLLSTFHDLCTPIPACNFPVSSVNMSVNMSVNKYFQLSQKDGHFTVQINRSVTVRVCVRTMIHFKCNYPNIDTTRCQQEGEEM